MSKAGAPAGPRADLTRVIEDAMERLHGIRSRSAVADIASELTRLNDGVRGAAERLLDPYDQPTDFPVALIRHADITNG